MLTVILASVGLTILAVAALAAFVWWLTSLCMRYDANDSLTLYRNPKTGRLVIPIEEVEWSEDGT